MGTKFTVYDNGVNPQKASASTLESGTLRQELAAVCYVSCGPWVSGLPVRHDTQDLLPVCGLFHLLLWADKEVPWSGPCLGQNAADHLPGKFWELGLPLCSPA